MTDTPTGGQEYKMGQLQSDVNAIKQKLSEIDEKIGSTHATHSESYQKLEDRVQSLERFRSRVLGALTVLCSGAAVAGAIVRAAGVI